MTVAYGAVYPVAYKMGSDPVSRIYLGTEPVWPGVNSAILSAHVGGGYSSWDSGNDGLTEATGYRKVALNTLGGYGTTNQLRIDVVASGKIHVKWSAALAQSDPNYGEVGMWRNLTPYAVNGPYPTVEWANGVTGTAGEIIQTVNAGEYFIFNVYDFAYWRDLRVWGEAYDSAEDAPLRLTSLPSRPTIANAGAATLTAAAAATGSLPQSYYWHKKNTTSGYTFINTNDSGTLSLTGLTYPADARTTYLCVANTFPSYGSDFHINCPEIDVVVIDPNPSMSIVTQPTNQTASGGTASFSVVATSTSPLYYAWYRAAPGSNVFLPSPGTATFATLNLTGLTRALDHGARYYCVVSYGGTGTPPTPLTSNTVGLVVYPDGDLFAEPNNAWSGIGFTGLGSEQYPFRKSGLYQGPSTLGTIVATTNGTVTIVTQTSMDTLPGFIKAYKNNVLMGSAGSTTAGVSGPFYAEFPVKAGDVIGIENTGVRFLNLQVFLIPS